MATGSGLQPQRGINVSNITPTVDLRTGEAQAWNEARRTFERLSEAAKPNLIRRAQERGAREGAEIARGEREAPGLIDRILTGGDVGEARIRAREVSYLSQVRNDVDRREQELRREFALDPEGYERASREATSGFIQGAWSEMAPEVEAYAQQAFTRGRDVVVNARTARDQQETVQALGVRIQTLDERLIALASQGGIGGEEYQAIYAERLDLQDERENNPAILYSPEQRALDDDRFDEAALGANVSRLAIESYSANGGGLPGRAAALRLLEDQVLNGEAFAGLTPERRRRVYQDATRQVNDFYAVDREEQRVRDEEDRERRAAEREAVGELQLDILLGGVSEADIQSRTDLSDASKARLIGAARAQVRRERAEARAISTLTAAGARANYSELNDGARAGTLSRQEIADALAAGQITPGQAQTLRVNTDRALRPVVDDVMAPVRDYARRPGMSTRGTAAAMATAEEAAAMFARDNPGVGLDGRLAAGRVIAERVFGGAGAGRPANAQAANNDRATQLRALEAERARRANGGRPMSQREYNERRNEILHGT